MKLRGLPSARKHPRPALATLRRGWGGVLADAGRKWSSDQAARLAAALSYYTAFSMAPLVLVCVAALSLVLGADAASSVVGDRLSALLGPERAALLQQLAARSAKPRAGGVAGVAGFLVVLWGASSVVGELQSSLDVIFGVPSARASLWDQARRRFVSMGFVLGAGFVMLVSLVLGTAASAAGEFFGGALGLGEGALQAFNQGASFVVVAGLFAAMFRWLPDARTDWADLAVGGAFTSALFTLGSYALALYLGKVGTTSAYGAAGALLAFLLWTYYCAQILYLGAEFTQAYARGRGRGVRPRRTAEAPR